MSEEPDKAFVPIESTEYWKEMEKNRVGNLLAGACLKAGLTQAQLAETLGIRKLLFWCACREKHCPAWLFPAAPGDTV